MREPHRIVHTPWPWLNDLWWWLRGVGPEDYRQLCRRCGRVGMVHYHLLGCWRFKRGAPK